MGLAWERCLGNLKLEVFGDATLTQTWKIWGKSGRGNRLADPR